MYGVQEKRKGDWFERLSGAVLWTLIRLFSGRQLPANVVTARLMSCRYVEALLLHCESEVDDSVLLLAGGVESTEPNTAPLKNPAAFKDSKSGQQGRLG